MIDGVYVGPNKAIAGRGAILREPVICRSEPEFDAAGHPMIMAQFNYLPEWKDANPARPTDTDGFRSDPFGYLCHGWHPFRRSDFKEPT